MTTKKLVPYVQAQSLLKEGDVLLFEGASLVGSLIQRAGEGKYSHVGIASGHRTNGHIFWECVEFREWKGGRTISLEQYVKENNIDVYRVSPENISWHYAEEEGKIYKDSVPFDGKAVTNTMRKMTGLPYGYKRIYWIAQHKIPFLRLLYSMDSIVDDNTEELVYPVCSTAIAYSFSKAGFDLVSNRGDEWTEPSDIARSALLHYLFTIV